MWDSIRIPDASWTDADIGELAQKYDTVEQHGWYSNLDPTVESLCELLTPGSLCIDYSGGTGILLDRLFAAKPDIESRIAIVDASPKFLRLALEKFRDDKRVAFRQLLYLKPERRLQYLDEVLEPSLRGDGADILCSTNAVHLYYDLDQTLAAWHRCLRPGATVLVQSGNIDNPQAAPGSWIIDDTVEKMQPFARALVETDDAFAEFRPELANEERNAAYAKLRRSYFLPVRPVAFYVDALSEAGFNIEQMEARPIAARTSEWGDFLAAYHDGVVGWAGGTRKLDGHEPEAATIELRCSLLRKALSALLEDADEFTANWSYIRCTRA
jgi:SAM-dependent methyltransferase